MTSYRYDKAGRLVQESAPGIRTDTTYDPLGRRSSLQTASGVRTVTLDFAYDGDDRMTRIRTSTQLGKAEPDGPVDQTLRWTDDGGVTEVLTETGGVGDSDFVYGYGRLAAATSTSLALLAADGHASALSTPASLLWVTASGYDPFGVAAPVASASAADTAFGYRGELTVGGDVYLRARLYDPGSGRFTTPDPVDGVPGQVTAANPYPYADNDPLNLTDRRGFRPADATWNCPPGRVAVPPPAGSYGPAQCVPEPQRPVYGPFLPNGPTSFERVPIPGGAEDALECATGEKDKPKGKKCKGRGAFGFVTKGACEVHKFAGKHAKVIRAAGEVAGFGAFVSCTVVTVGTCAVVGGAVVAGSFASEVAIEGKVTKGNVAKTAVDAALVRIGKIPAVAEAGDVLASRVVRKTGSRFAGGVYKWGWEIGYGALSKFGSDAFAGLK